MLRTGGWQPPSVARGGLDPVRRRPGLPERRRAATTVTWRLLRPDFHRQVIVSFQDTLRVNSPALERLNVGLTEVAIVQGRRLRLA